MARTKKNNNVTMNELNEMMIQMMNNMNAIMKMYNDLQNTAVHQTINQTVASNKTTATTRVAAPKPDTTADTNTADSTTTADTTVDTTKKLTRSEAIRNWKIKKYGSEEAANRVSAMTKVVADEWAAQARATGKFVVPRNKYKEELWKEAEKRVNYQIAKEAKAASKA